MRNGRRRRPFRVLKQKDPKIPIALLPEVTLRIKLK